MTLPSGGGNRVAGGHEMTFANFFGEGRDRGGGGGGGGGPGRD